MNVKKLFIIGLFLTLLSACTSVTPSTNQLAADPLVPETVVPTSRPPIDAPTPMTPLKVRPKSVTLNVFAAASLTAAFRDIGKTFEAANPGVTVVNNFAGSQQLAQQINQGAPADVFASANLAQMAVVISGGEVTSGTQQIFATNLLTIIYPKDNPAKLSKLQDLANPGLKLVLEDSTVPAGAYALTFLEKASKEPGFGLDFNARVLNNVVSYENDVKVVLTKVALGEGDAGIVYTTDAAAADPSKVSQIIIPDVLNVVASYPVAPVNNSLNLDLARVYIDYLLSTDGQNILAKYGFIPVKK